MTPEELTTRLVEMVEHAEDGEKMLALHLFGIKYAAEIQTCSSHVKDIVAAAQMNKSFTREIQKGVKLAKYVMLK